MLKYLDKIKVMAETASNGLECTEMVFSKEPGYYSLIIVSASMYSYQWIKPNSIYSVIFKCQSRTATIPVAKSGCGN